MISLNIFSKCPYNGNPKTRLKNLLNKPFEEIMEIWKSKQIYRDQYDDEWLLGMKSHAGKLGAKYIDRFISENTRNI